MNSPSTEHLADLIDRKHTCLLQLRELGTQQMRLVDQGEMGELLKVLSGKQYLINLLQELEQQLDPYRHDDPESRQWRSPQDRARCAQQSEACQMLLDEVLQQEKVSEASLTVRRDEVARRLQGVHSARQARSAYAQQSGPATSQLDLSSK